MNLSTIFSSQHKCRECSRVVSEGCLCRVLRVPEKPKPATTKAATTHSYNPIKKVKGKGKYTCQACQNKFNDTKQITFCHSCRKGLRQKLSRVCMVCLRNTHTQNVNLRTNNTLCIDCEGERREFGDEFVTVDLDRISPDGCLNCGGHLADSPYRYVCEDCSTDMYAFDYYGLIGAYYKEILDIDGED